MGARPASAAILAVAAALLASIVLFRHLVAPPRLERMTLLPLGSFDHVPGWARDDLTNPLAVFLRSCAALERLPAGKPLDPAGREGFGRDWAPICRRARMVPLTPRDARQFFEQNFAPVVVLDRGRPDGLFTGYYEPELHGSRTRSGRYRVPLLGVPPDLVSVNLGAFAPDLGGRRIAGRIVGNRLEPYPDRLAIESGGLANKARPILWLDDPVEAFFLHIQGAGRVILDNGEIVRVGYAAQNGRPYVPIGRLLVQSGALSREAVSLQSIRAWLNAHPDQAPAVMAANPSYVFFRVLDSADPRLGPPGSQQVPLTPGRSLAVDTGFHGLGVPIWLDARLPDPKPGMPDRALQRLLVAQDTGGAIRGPVRGDVFWGFGPEAEAVAGRMKSPGQLVLLLPRAVVERLARGEAAGPE